MGIKSSVAPSLTRANLFMAGYLTRRPCISLPDLELISRLPEVPEGHALVMDYFKRFEHIEAAE